MTSYALQIMLQSPLTSAAGEGRVGLVDRDVAFDEAGPTHSPPAGVSKGCGAKPIAMWLMRGPRAVSRQYQRIGFSARQDKNPVTVTPACISPMRNCEKRHP